MHEVYILLIICYRVINIFILKETRGFVTIENMRRLLNPWIKNMFCDDTKFWSIDYHNFDGQKNSRKSVKLCAFAQETNH